ncbi:hypothetical protein ACYOEI_34960, partial [Singulisphaera rosea]
MPSGKPSQPAHNGGAKESIANLGQKIQEGAQVAGERLQENLGTAREAAAHRYRQAEGVMARNPAPSVLIGFGVGFGLGLVLTTMLSRP